VRLRKIESIAVTMDKLNEDSSAWEALCHRCGQCCFEKGIDGKGRIIETGVPCRHLDIHSRLCRVYPQRQQIEFDCIKLKPENIASLKWLPANCAYRQWLEDLKG